MSINNQKVPEKHWQGRHAKQLVKILALSQQHQLHREQLMEQLWPDSSAQQSVNRLNKAIYWARRAFEPQLQAGSDSQFLQRAGDSIQLGATVDLCVDVVEFETTANKALSDRDAETLHQASLLYTGDLLLEDPFDDLFEPRREQLAQLFERVLHAQFELADAENNSSVKTELLLKLLRCDPLNEQYYQQLIQHYMVCGERSKAVAQLKRCQELFQQELGETPQRETLELVDQTPEKRSVRPTRNSQIASVSSVDLDHNTVAVLPFENVDDATDLDYLCEGISDDLIIRLSQAPDLKVIARSTVFRFRNMRADPITLGQKLSVGTVVLGQLERHSERLKVWVELVSTNNGSIRWAQQYDIAISEVLELRSKLVTDLSEQFLSTLTHGTQNTSTRNDTTNENAYHEYLKGRYNWNKRSSIALQRALEHFSYAIDYDPVYALAYSGLADTYNVVSLYTAQSPHDTMPKAKAAAQKALAINPESGEALASLGYYTLSYEWDARAAESIFQSAIQLNPNYPLARQWYHKLLISESRLEEANQQIKLAYQNDPLSVMVSIEKAWGLYYSKRYSQAVKHLETLLLSDPHFPMAHYLLGLCRIHEHNFNRAVDALESALQQATSSDPFPLATGTLGYVFARLDESIKAKEQLNALQSLSDSSGVTDYAMALVQLGLRNTDNALTLLHQACDQRFDRLIFLDHEGLLDPLRDKPEFDALRARVFTSDH